jgi:hypothetical protein
MNEPILELYSPLLIHRDPVDGSFYHPHLPAWESDQDDERDITPLLTEQGFSIVQTTPDDDWAQDPLSDAYAEAFKAWQPQPPDNTGTWLLAAIVDTEDGPQAWFVRRFNPVNQTDTE